MSIIPSLKSLSMNDVSLNPSFSQFASGVVTSSSTSISGVVTDDGTTVTVCFVQVTGLNFIPKRIVIETSTPSTLPTIVDMENRFGTGVYSHILYNVEAHTSGGSNFYINATGFKVPAEGPSVACKWYAYA